MRYLEDFAMGHLRARRDRLWERIKRCAAVALPATTAARKQRDEAEQVLIANVRVFPCQ
jgi:hypothetical protein